MVKMINYKFMISLVLLVLLISYASAELNLKITANLNGLSADFNAVTEPFAENGFDGSDVPFITPPSNYISLYSNIPTQNNVNKLVLDAWNQSANPRTLNLTLFTSTAQMGQLDLTWTGASNYSIVLNDYAGDSLRRVPITGGSTTLSTTGSGTYSVNLLSTITTRYYSLVVTNTTTSTADTTPPGPVTSLGYSYKTRNNILWVWANPTDSDFDSAIVYADGVNVANTSLGKYNATGLATNTTHTIRINTKDFAGNVNYLNVTSNTSTSATSGVVKNPNPPLGPGVGGVGSPLGPGTGTIANLGSSGAGEGLLGGEGFLAPGEGLPANATAAQRIIYKTKNALLDYLSKQSRATLISYAIALIAAILLIVYGIKHHKQSKSSANKNKIVNRKK